ncbi:MAG: VIT1/CCC1 transporter family protein, partial [Acidobacteriota bacterium]
APVTRTFKSSLAIIFWDHNVLLVSGLAGMIADSLSMGSSGYLAAKSEQDLYANEIRMEEEELELMPELEKEELVILYQGQGLDAASARERAEAVMENKAQALEEMVRLELGLNPDQAASPLKEGWITGTATAVGAFIPILPFLFSSGTVAIVNSVILSMFSHFLVGAGRSVFTGRGLIRSGIDMFLVGLGVAVIGYFFGDMFVRLFT